MSLSTSCSAAASSTLKVPSTSTSSASRGSSAHWVMRIAAWWKTRSLPRVRSWTRSRSRRSPSTQVHPAAGERVVEVGPATADQVVEHVDVRDARVEQLVDDVEPIVPAPPVTRTVGACERAHADLPPADGSSAATALMAAPRAARGCPLAASSTESTRSPASPSVRGGRRFADGGGELGRPSGERLALGQRRGPDVAEPVGDVAALGARRVVRGLEVQVDAAVVDAQPLLRVEVVPDEGALRAADHHLADLGRAEPVDVDVGDGAAGERHRQVADARLARAERIGTVRRHRLGVQAAGKDEVEDRQVVGREVPEHVDVGLDQAEVDADASR